MCKLQKSSLMLLSCLLLAGMLGACGGAAASSAPTANKSATPGIGVPVVGGMWEVVVASASKADQWSNQGAKSGFLFVLVDVTFYNLDASQPTNVSLKETLLMTSDGQTLPPFGFDTKQSAHPPDTVDGKDLGITSGFGILPTLGSKGTTLGITLVYILAQNQANQLKFVFQQVPAVPFAAS